MDQSPSSSPAPGSGLANASNREREAQLAAIVARDATCDGQFVYAVQTTGVYCRPSCTARAPLPRNVEFYPTCTDAERAGYRACKRCNPNGLHPQLQAQTRVAELCRLIDQSGGPVPLRVLAQHAGLSPSRTQRLFKAVTGVSPTQYGLGRRDERVRQRLVEHASERASRVARSSLRQHVTDVLYSCGYNSVGRFYARSGQVLGMSPSHYRTFGTGETIRVAIGACELGDILVAATARGVCSVALGDDAEALMVQFQSDFKQATLVPGDPLFDEWVAQVVGLVQLGTVPKTLPLDLRGTLFQQRVWTLLAQIPFGQQRTYTDIARSLGDANLARAVASACAANRVAVAIPCHRVVRRDGSLSGYRWGVERKRALLDREHRRKPVSGSGS